MLEYETALLNYDNYRKSFLPSLNLSITPANFNHSMKLLQDSYSGDYNNIDEYVNNSAATITISQRIGIIGGTLSATTGLSMLNELSKGRNSFSSTPFAINYYQPILGGYKNYMFERRIQDAQRNLAKKTLIAALAKEQQDVALLYIDLCVNEMEVQMIRSEIAQTDTLIYWAEKKHETGNITDFDLNQLKLEQLKKRQNLLDQEASLETARHALTSRLELIGENLVFAMPKNIQMPDYIDEEEVRVHARENNPYEISLNLQEEQAMQTCYKQRLSTRFSGSISLSYGLNQYSQNFIGAYTHPNQRQAIIVSLNVPVLDWGISKNRRRIADIAHAHSSMQIDEARDDIDWNIHELTSSYNRVISSYKISSEQLKLADEQCRIAIKRYAIGSISHSELFTMDYSRRAAQRMYLSNIRNLYSGYFALRSLALYDFTRSEKLEVLYGFE